MKLEMNDEIWKAWHKFSRDTNTGFGITDLIVKNEYRKGGFPFVSYIVGDEKHVAEFILRYL